MQRKDRNGGLAISESGIAFIELGPKGNIERLKQNRKEIEDAQEKMARQ